MRFSTETENCTGLKMSGGLETVWKWSGFPGARVYDPQKHNDSPGGEPKSVQNRSGFRGGGFLIFEIGSAGGAEPALSRRQLPRVHGTTREGNYEAISRASGTRPQRHREPKYVSSLRLCASVANY